MSPAFHVTLSPCTLALGIGAAHHVWWWLSSCRQVVVFSLCYVLVVPSESYPFQGIASLLPVLLTIGAGHPLLETAQLRNPHLSICRLNWIVQQALKWKALLVRDVTLLAFFGGLIGCGNAVPLETASWWGLEHSSRAIIQYQEQARDKSTGFGQSYTVRASSQLCKLCTAETHISYPAGCLTGKGIVMQQCLGVLHLDKAVSIGILRA